MLILIIFKIFNKLKNFTFNVPPNALKKKEFGYLTTYKKHIKFWINIRLNLNRDFEALNSNNSKNYNLATTKIKLHKKVTFFSADIWLIISGNMQLKIEK